MVWRTTFHRLQRGVNPQETCHLGGTRNYYYFHYISELHTAFSMLDANHDGRVSLDELQDMLSRMGFNIPREALDILLQDKTTSSTGQVRASLNGNN